jgi:hypothetical protein
VEPRTSWVDPPLAEWARANAELEADRLRVAIVADRAHGVDLDESLASLRASFRRLTAAQTEAVAAQLYSRE